MGNFPSMTYWISHFFLTVKKSGNINSLKEKRFILVLSLRDFRLLLATSMTLRRTSWWKRMGEQSYSCHTSQKSERKTEGDREDKAWNHIQPWRARSGTHFPQLGLTSCFHHLPTMSSNQCHGWVSPSWYNNFSKIHPLNTWDLGRIF